MKNIVIVGTSGVGKTFLEQELETQKISYQIPKYTNRESRPGENSTKTVCIPSSEFENLLANDDFFFTLNYGGFKYGWKKSDLKLHHNLPATIAITLESLEGFLIKNPNFLAILLTINNNDLSLIEKRLYDRENIDLLSKNQLREIKLKISQRLSLARQELEQIENYKKIVISNGGRVFYIKDNQTIFSEIIPDIKKIFGLFSVGN
jgi:guanylate kinase